MLIDKFQVHVLPAGQVKLEFFVPTNSCLAFDMPLDGFWGFVHLIATRANSADWGISLPAEANLTGAGKTVN